MYFKKLAVFCLTIVFCFSTFLPAYADNNTAIEKIEKVEVVLYGTEQKGALIERANSLEEDIYGHTSSEAILTKIENIYEYVTGKNASSEPSFLTKLNAVEWTFAEKLSEGPAKNRLEEVEKLLHGRADNGSISDRINVLMSLAFTDGEIEVRQVVLPQDLLIKISIAQNLESKTAQEGEDVVFRSEDNVYIGDVLVIPKGAVGHGVIKKVSRARNFGRNAKIEIEYTDITTIDNTGANVLLGDLAKEATESLAIAAGASVAGMIVLGPVGVIGGAFIKGKEYNIPEGALLYVQTASDTLVNGIYVPGANDGSDEDDFDYGDGGL